MATTLLPLEAAQRETEMAVEEGDAEKDDREKEDFTEVNNKRKRKQKSVEMEVENETAVKRPSFPPIDVSLTQVRCIMKCCTRNVKFVMLYWGNVLGQLWNVPGQA